MDLAHLKRHLPSIEDGRWVDRDEVPDLGDIRLKLRGASSPAFRAEYSKRERNAPMADRDAKGAIKGEAALDLVLAVTLDVGLIETEGLTENGNPMPIDRVRELARLPEYQPLADLVMQALSCVDQTREARMRDVAGNSQPSSSGIASMADRPRVSAKR